MRLVVMCVASLLLMQLPATASIISPFSSESAGQPAGWNGPYGQFAWDTAKGVFRFAPFHGGLDIEPAELVLASAAFQAIAVRGFELPAPDDLAAGDHSGPTFYQVALLNHCSSVSPEITAAHWSAKAADADFDEHVRIAATSVCPEPATLMIWGFSALALAAATYRRQKRNGRTGKHVQQAVQEYLEACTGPSEHFRLLGSYLTTLADDPNWSKQDIEAFYDEVVVALHRRREHAEVA